MLFLNLPPLSPATYLVSIQMGLILLLFNSCGPANQPQPANNNTDSSQLKITAAHKAIAGIKPLLKDGLLITRSDDDYESLVLQNFSQKERAYSHSGIIFKEADSFVVYHCMGGKENPGEACRRDAFDSFVNPLEKTGFGLFKYQLTDTETVALHNAVQAYHQASIPFDANFNLANDDSLYCSEMIYKALLQATHNRVVLPTSTIKNFKPKIPGYKSRQQRYKSFEYIGIDDLYLNPFCTELTRVTY
jgi:hypothetical protein